VSSGGGAVAEWDLGDSPLGLQTAKVEVTDGRGGLATGSVQVEVKVCGACDAGPCPTLELSCPDTAVAGELIPFYAAVGQTSEKLTYTWKVTNGKIVKGSETPTIEVQVTETASEMVTAVVSVKGFPPTCGSQASCSAKIEKKR
jgi:hypothetical protein